MILETDRLFLREMVQSDYASLCDMLQSERVMYAYGSSFSDDEALQWLDRQFQRYSQYGFGLWAVVLKETGEMIGQCGITMQDCDGRQVHEIGYLFKEEHWHQGYATEAAIGCREYAFNVLKLDEVYSIIRDTNTASQRVAIRNGMSQTGQFTKHYRGIDMPHLVFSIRNGSNQ